MATAGASVAPHVNETALSEPPRSDRSLSVVVVNYQTWADTADLLEGLRGQLDTRYHEILVVNNCNQTRLPESLKDARVRFVESVRNVGFAGAVNLAAACAEGRKLLVLNPDVRPHRSAIDALLDAHARNPKAGVLLPRLVSEDGSDQLSVRSFYRFETILAARTAWGRVSRGRRILSEHLGRQMNREEEQPVDWGLGAAMLIDPTRIPWERGRIMDERFFLYMEDVDLCLRTWRAGQQVVYVPNAVFTHTHRRESKRRPFSLANLRHFLSLLRFTAKYRGLPQRPTE